MHVVHISPPAYITVLQGVHGYTDLLPQCALLGHFISVQAWGQGNSHQSCMGRDTVLKGVICMIVGNMQGTLHCGMCHSVPEGLH